MKNLALLSGLYLIFLGAAQAQISISFCPDLKSDIAPIVYMGEAFRFTQMYECGPCSTTCEMPIKDPIGGYAMSYYTHRNKESGKLAFIYEIGQGIEDLKDKLTTRVDVENHKLQDKKAGVQALWVQKNGHLDHIGGELEDILKSSYYKFQDLASHEAPWGELAYVFETLAKKEDCLRLSVSYKGEQARGYMDVMLDQAQKMLPQYQLHMVGDTAFQGGINPEYPSFEFRIARSRETMDWTFYPPQRREAPELIFNYTQLRRSRSSIDTLVSTKLKSGKQGYALGLHDESGIEKLTMDGIDRQLRSGDTSLFVVDANPELNGTVVAIEAVDIHGNFVSKKLFLLEHELDKPRFGLFDPNSGKYLAPGDEVILDKYNQRFQLLGRVSDASPLRSIRVNGRSVKWDDKNEFTSSLLPSDNGKKMKVEVADAHGNAVTSEFKITFKESGADRKMKLEAEEEFSSRNEAYLIKNGMHGLTLEIKNDKFYIQKMPVIDTTQSAAAADDEMAMKPKNIGEAVAFGLPSLNFNSDFDLQISYSTLLEKSQFFLTFGMDESWESYYYVFGEGDNLFLGQVDNKLFMCRGEGCDHQQFNNVYATFPYLQRARVTPGFFDRGRGVEYILNIKRYNEFYLGSKDDPKDWLFVEIKNGIDPPATLQFALTESNTRIVGTKSGVALWDNTSLAVNKITFKKGQQGQAPAFFDDKDIEKYCFPTCYNVDTTEKKDFFDCLNTNYQALIVANGDFGGRISNLPTAVATGTQLRDLLINDYQFPEDQVTFLPNATKDQFLEYLEKILPSHSTKETRLLIWVISHGAQDKTIEFKDAPLQADDIWNRLNKKKTDGNYAFECKQILFVLDACFSGEMTPSKQQEYNPNRTVCDANGKGARLAITSASDKPTRESQLSKEMIKHLIQNSSRYMTIDKLFDLAKKDFLKEMSGNTDPTLTVFESTNHEANGSFLFIKKKFFQ